VRALALSSGHSTASEVVLLAVEAVAQQGRALQSVAAAAAAAVVVLAAVASAAAAADVVSCC
jgi:hypothetical protein